MRLHFLVQGGRRSGERLALEPPGGTIGRERSSAIWLPDPCILPLAAELLWQDERWWLKSPQCASILDEEPVGAQPRPLRAHGVLQLGIVKLQYWQRAIAAGTASDPTLLLGAGTVLLPQPTLLLPPAPSSTPPPAVARAVPPTLVRLPSPPGDRSRQVPETPSAQLAQLKHEVLALLLPFSDRLQQASEALGVGDGERARQLLRAASFALGDLRSLLENP